MRRGARKLLHRAKQDPKLQTKTTKKICSVLTKNMHLNIAGLRPREIGPTRRAQISPEVETMKAMTLRTESRASRWRATRSMMAKLKRLEIRQMMTIETNKR